MKTYILGKVGRSNNTPPLVFKIVIFGEYYVEFVCSICTSRKISNQKEEEKKRKRVREERKKERKKDKEERKKEREREREREREEEKWKKLEKRG